jgi:hypothetical protein
MKNLLFYSKLDYVALGDSFIWGFVDLYAAHIESDLNLPVTLHNFSAGGQGSQELLASLREIESLRVLLRSADVITFMIPMAHFKQPSIDFINGGDLDNQAGMRAAFDLYRRDADEIFAELLSLRKPSEAMLRVMDCYLPPFLFGEWKKAGAFAQLKVWWDAFNGHVAQLATEYHIPLAHVREAFNGMSGEVNPLEFISEDGWHANESGAALIAELHRELGYAPITS